MGNLILVDSLNVAVLEFIGNFLLKSLDELKLVVQRRTGWLVLAFDVSDGRTSLLRSTNRSAVNTVIRAGAEATPWEKFNGRMSV